MNITTVTVIDLLKAHLFKTKVDFSYLDTLSSEDWIKVYYFTCRHNIQALVYDAISELEAKPENFNKLPWIVAVDKIERHYDRTVEVVRELERVSKENGLRFMVLKGLGLCKLYPNPRHRTMSDIDLYFYKDYERAMNVFRNNLGLSFKDRTYDHHSSFIYKGILVENHYDFINTSVYKEAVELNDVLKQYAASGKNEILHLLFNLNHLAKHFAVEVISVRHLLDWVFLWRKYSTQVDLREFYSVVEKFGKVRFYNGLCGVIVKLFGVKERELYSYVKDEKLANRMIGNIMNPDLDTEDQKRIWVTFRRFCKNIWKYKLVYPSETILWVLVKKFVFWLRKIVFIAVLCCL